MATDYYSWEKMTLHATGENGRTAELAVRLGPSHRRWLIVGHSETMNRDGLFAYIEKRLLRGERLVHLGKEPLLTLGRKLTTPDGNPNPDPNPPYTLPFRIVDKQYGSPPESFYRQELVVQFNDGTIAIRALSSRAALPRVKLYPWVKLDEQVEGVPYYVGSYARNNFPGRKSHVELPPRRSSRSSRSSWTSSHCPTWNSGSSPVRCAIWSRCSRTTAPC